MKQSILNTFAVIGIITTFVLACSAVMDESTLSTSIEEGKYQFELISNNSVFILNTTNGEMMRFDIGDYFDTLAGYEKGTFIDVLNGNPFD